MRLNFVHVGFLTVGIAVSIKSYDNGHHLFPTTTTVAFTVPASQVVVPQHRSLSAITNVNRMPRTVINISNNNTENSFDSMLRLSKRTNSMDIPYHVTIAALRNYHTLHGDLVLPRRYIVPTAQGFPREWVGLDLAATVYTMKWWKRNIRTEETKRVSELNNLGFLWERLQPEWNIVLEALITYHALHSHVMVPNKFVVPYGSFQWPKATWGIPLGNCVYRIRSRNDFLHGSSSYSRRSQLDSLHFVWDAHEQSFLKFFAILRHYAKLTKTGKFTPPGIPTKPLKVPATFQVPSNDDRWPKELWNYQLGAKCIAVRQKELYVKDKPRRRRMLEELGFRWCGNAELSWLKVVHAAAIYSRLNGHSLDVPYKFVVPCPTPVFVATRPNGPTEDGRDDNGSGEEEEWPWPEYLWSLPLGQRIKDIRIAGAYLKGKDKVERMRQLDALGFVWDVREHRRQQKQLNRQHDDDVTDTDQHHRKTSQQMSFQEAST